MAGFAEAELKAVRPSWRLPRSVALHGFGTVLREILSRGTPRPVIVFPPDGPWPERPLVPRRLFAFALFLPQPMKVNPVGSFSTVSEPFSSKISSPSVGRWPCRFPSSDMARLCHLTSRAGEIISPILPLVESANISPPKPQKAHADNLPAQSSSSGLSSYEPKSEGETNVQRAAKRRESKDQRTTSRV